MVKLDHKLAAIVRSTRSEFRNPQLVCARRHAIRTWISLVHVRAVALAVACLLVGASGARASDGAALITQVARQVQPKVVKIYGAGGVRGLEHYQSGILI